MLYSPRQSEGMYNNLALYDFPTPSKLPFHLSKFYSCIRTERAFQVVLAEKNPLANAGDIRDVGPIPGLGRLPWRRAYQPTPVFLSGESHRQRNLAGYSPWGHKELDMTEVT